MRIVFMGTPDFASGILKKLSESGHEIVLCVTQPDRPSGRKKEPVPCPVKKLATELGIPVFQPEKIRDEEATKRVLSEEPDLIAVAAFGQILPKTLLETPRFGCVNVHASLLPKYRGASPIQNAILDGEKVTGVTLMQMDEGLDTGDILATEEVVIEDDETGGSLFDKLTDAGAKLLSEKLDEIEKGTLVPVPQGDSPTAYCRMIKKEDGAFDPSVPVSRLERMIRAYDPWPGVYGHISGKTFKIWKARIADKAPGREGGTLIVEDGRLYLCCGDGALILEQVQIEGKKRMDADDFLRGARFKEGELI